MTLDPITLAIASSIGGVTLAIAGWVARQAVERLDTRLQAIEHRDKRASEELANLTLVVTEWRAEMRGELAAMHQRVAKTEEGQDANSKAHGTIHGRIDGHAERLTRVETLQGMQGVAS